MMVMVALGMERRRREASASPAAPAPAITIWARVSEVWACACVMVREIGAPASNAARPLAIRNLRLFILCAPLASTVGLYGADSDAGPVDDLFFCHRPRDAGDLAAAGKKDHCRYATYAKMCGNPGLGIGIELQQAHFRLKVGCSGFKSRRHHLAGTAPWSPDINQNRQVAMLRLSLERRSIGVKRATGEQPVLAAATSGSLGRPVQWHSIDTGTMRTDDLATDGHLTDTTSLSVNRALPRQAVVDYIFE